MDIDQALTGIDKLLKSQELTFAFVGVAPALSIVYLVGGYLKSVWTGGRGRGRYGGKHERAGVWFAIRYAQYSTDLTTDILINSSFSHEPGESSVSLPPSPNHPNVTPTHPSAKSHH